MEFNVILFAFCKLVLIQIIWQFAKAMSMDASDKIDSQLEFLQGNKEYVAHSHNVIKRILLLAKIRLLGKRSLANFISMSFFAVGLFMQ